MKFWNLFLKVTNKTFEVISHGTLTKIWLEHLFEIKAKSLNDVTFTLTLNCLYQWRANIIQIINGETHNLNENSFFSMH